MKVNLNKIMAEIVNANLKCYRDDLETDINILLDKKHNTDEFYWSVSEAGTYIYKPIDLRIAGEFCNNCAKEHLEKSKCLFFKIKVSKRGKKYVYGTIEPVVRKEFRRLTENTINLNSIKATEVLLITNDDKELVIKYNNYESKKYNKMLLDFKVNPEDCKKVYINYIV